MDSPKSQDSSSKYGVSRVTSSNAPQPNKPALDSSFKGGGVREPILLNSNSEAAESQLIHDASEVTHPLLEVDSNEISSHKQQ